MKKLVVLLAMMLSACGGHNDYVEARDPYANMENDDKRALIATHEYIAAQGGPANTQFDYVLEDMNGDGQRDAIALFKLPYSYWCGMSGCTMAVFENTGDSFNPVSHITSVRGPVVLTERITSGWRDIAIRTSGTNLRDRDVAMRFDGTTYPNNPTGQAALGESIYGVPGRRIFP